MLHEFILLEIYLFWEMVKIKSAITFMNTGEMCMSVLFCDIVSFSAYQECNQYIFCEQTACPNENKHSD